MGDHGSDQLVGLVGGDVNEASTVDAESALDGGIPTEAEPRVADVEDATVGVGDGG